MRIIGERLESTEFKANLRLKWTTLTLDNMEMSGKSIQNPFERLEKKFIDLEKTLEMACHSEEMHSDFFERVPEDELFDWEENVSVKI